MIPEVDTALEKAIEGLTKVVDFSKMILPLASNAEEEKEGEKK